MKRMSPTDSPPCSQRGAAAGALLFTCVLAAVAVGGYLWLQGRNDRSEAGQTRAVPENGVADKWTGRLGKFLRAGPTSGTWETRALSCVYTNYVAPHPTSSEKIIIAQVDAQGTRSPIIVSRWMVSRHFFRSPPHLFFTNYVRTEGPIRGELELGEGDHPLETYCVHWGPRGDRDSLTERLVWFSVVGGEVVQIEDRSRDGSLIRRVRRISKGTGLWDPKELDLDSLESQVGEAPGANADPESRLAADCASAPFDVYIPSYLPPGFVLARSSFSVCDATLTPAERPGQAAPGAGVPVQLISQLYSDGLALISVGVAQREDMNIIENLTAGMAETDDPAACPGLPAEPRDIRHNGSVIRMRRDTCRIVLRRDDLPGVSVTIIGRRELPDEEYLRMIASLEKVPAVR